MIVIRQTPLQDLFRHRQRQIRSFDSKVLKGFASLPLVSHAVSAEIRVHDAGGIPRSEGKAKRIIDRC